MDLAPLPIDSHLEEIVAAVRRARAAVVVAAPGAGKTTRVPPALVADGRVILLQPRRVAARSIAARIASERGWTLGREVGWQVRFDRRFSSETRLLVVTEGILTARLQSDPLLGDYMTIVLDEFHERSIHGDLAMALARQAWRARDDLRIVVMSATLDAEPVSNFLGGCPVVDVPGRVFPLEIAYAPGQRVAEAVVDVARATPGNVLCFLPGAAEIRRAIGEVAANLPNRPNPAHPANPANYEILPLHGSLPASEQDRALAESDCRRIIVATNIAETSLTVPGVTAVVDTGFHKVARYDASRGIDSLEVERITADAADQRAGRAGRIAPGIVRRLWDSRDRLRPHREPEIHRVDLAAAVLDIVAWGGDPDTFEWFDMPPRDALQAAIVLLERLELIAGRTLTPLGDRARRLPVHPRLARMLLAADGARDVARACALLSERHVLPPRRAATSSDLLSAIDAWSDVPAHVHRAAEEIERVYFAIDGEPRSRQRAKTSEAEFRRAVSSGYPDRVARRRDTASDRFLLASGAGAMLSRDSGVHDGEFIVALDVSASDVGRGDAIVRIASRIERDWLTPTSSEVVHRFDAASGTVRAARVDRYEALVLNETPEAPDSGTAAALLADAWLERGARGDDEKLLRRLKFAGRAVDVGDLARGAAVAARSIDDVRLVDHLPRALVRDLDREAPEKLTVPSGRSVPLEYHDDGTVSMSVKLQELFGLADTPRVGTKRTPLRLALLAPNGRPVQVTQDLRGFWERTYPEVRKELRGRYPKHKWPEDPWTASPVRKPHG